MSNKNLSYQERIAFTSHPLTQRLLHLIHNKQTNLALSADVTQKQQLLALADQCGPEICILKTHIDIIEDFDAELIEQLKKLANKHQFLIFEDRKFADIGNTVQLQYQAGIYHIAAWADIINAHYLPGPGIIAGLKKIGLPLQRGLLLVAEMSSAGNLATGTYTQTTIEMAEQHKDFVMGFICQHKLIDDPGLLHMTPGVGIASKGDSLGQNYLHPDEVILEHGTDIIIVGRGIYGADSPQQAAQQFRTLGWQAYLKRIKK